ncbi:sigma-70 family RNA polymerase sigma factor [Fervidibacillus halotolerans]|uniref:Sigma-70 family RNA polymerase sigma factor n=1 Tax=Fervidibacillus halotolerans TaxID=2980027 RepID=A0A9E8LYE8_9BACI|nr:sigma-70 family RNA polymerase sigma factor [Fervidibacillus halotolerans]WAA12058.1 sigma-70 family RNA polymerase sigma factor [Fervidibacillus halotolerans]
MKTFEEIEKEMRPMIFSIIRGLNIYKNYDEYVQIGLIGLWKAYITYDPKIGAFPTYAYHYIRGTILTELRKEKKKEERELQVKEEDWKIIGGSVHDELFIHQFIFEELLAKLPEKKQQLARLYFYEGIELKEIAKRFQIGYSTAKLWKREVIHYLRKEWENEY